MSSSKESSTALPDFAQSPPQLPTSRQPGSSCANELLLGALVTSAVAAGALEWEHYRRLLQWEELDLRLWDKVVVFWKLWAAVLAPLLPVIIIAALVERRRGGRWVFVSSSAAVLTILAFVAVDLSVHNATGRHIADYVPYALFSTAREWAGGAAIAGWATALRTIAVVTVGVVLLHVCRAAWRSVAELAPAATPLLSRGLIAASSVVTGGLGPVNHLATSCELLTRLDESLHLSIAGAVRTSGDLGRFRIEFNRHASRLYEQLHPRVVEAQPADTTVRIERSNPPNVVLIVLESFRYDALTPDVMPKTHQWAARGLRFTRHYAGSNSSHLGLFGLLYGRSPIVYESALESGVPPQLTTTMRRSGYRCTFLSGGTLEWVGMDKFINEQTFDRIRVDLDGDWPERDRRALAEIRRIIHTAGATPQLVIAFLMSTHFDYQYPPEYARYTPVITDYGMDDPRLRDRRHEFWNRYRNAAGFMDDELAKLFRDLDPRQNVVVVTGDHGESLWDDATLAHSSRASEIQTRVPLAMFGPNVPAASIACPTRHADVLPTLFHVLAGKAVPVANTHGRDVLSNADDDSVVLAPVRFYQPHHLVLIRRNQRLRVRLWFNRPRIDVVGFFDDADNLDFRYAPTEWEWEGWLRILAQELRRLST
jgi:hypothetical protein